jgi:NADPH:quinone reductase-like Zn-dependent oxidoreductase
MKSLVMTNFGGLDVLENRDIPVPTPGPSEILVRIHATGLNPVDFKIREGHLKEIFPVKFPHILGGDISGEVVAVGVSVHEFAPGDEVFFSNPLDRHGGFAEFVAVDQAIVARKPKTINHVQAASLPVAGLTSIQALRDFAGIKPKMKVLIHAGAGGVGSFAIQYAKHKGAVVYTTASASKADYVRSLGADHVIDYNKVDFVEVAQTAGGMDIVLETIGGANYLRSIIATKNGGAVPSIVNPPDEETKTLANEKHIKTDFMLLNGSRDDLNEIVSLVDCGLVQPMVSETFPFDDIRKGLIQIESGRSKGKLVIEMV